MDQGIISIGVAPMRSEPSSRSEMVSQAILGTTINIERRESGWLFCETADGYHGWLEGDNCVNAIESRYAGIAKGNIQTVWALWDFVREEPQKNAPALIEVVRGTSLIITSELNDWFQVCLPDGREGFIFKQNFIRDVKNSTRSQIVFDACACLGISYLWGGTTVRGFDCSGFVQAVFSWNNIALPRDSHLQAEIGELIQPDSNFANIFQADLLYFGQSDNNISHVAISLSGMNYVHAGNYVQKARLDREKLKTLCYIRRIIP